MFDTGASGTMVSYLIIILLVASIAAAMAGLFRARKQRELATVKVHSRPIYHALNAAIWTGVPAFIFLILWSMSESSFQDMLVLSSFPGADQMTGPERNLLISEIRQVRAGNLFTEPSPEVLVGVEHLRSLEFIFRWAMVAVAASLASIGAFFGFRIIQHRYQARYSVERSVTWFMIFSSIVAIVTTLGIVSSLVYEAAQFFAKVPFTEFFFGLRWEPQIAIRADQVAGQGAFGMIPVLFGTMVISLLAMLVAIPTGIFSAISLAEYANSRFRSVVKPLLEILAGIPTIVYGFFAVLTVAPAIRNLAMSLGIDASPNSALAAGGVMGVMLIPFISSLSDDAFAAVPRAMRDGSYALGATKGETIRKVLLPAALPGIIGGVLLALSRAIGETMIVVMAAGLIAKMTLNPFESVTTVTVQIVTLLIGDSEFDNPKTLAAFALGLVLFTITLGLNLIALHTVRKYREKY